MSSTLREASKDTLQVNEKTWHYYSLPLAEKQLGEISRLPKSLKVLMENLLRWQDGDSVTEEDIRAWPAGCNRPMPTGKSPTVRHAS